MTNDEREAIRREAREVALREAVDAVRDCMEPLAQKAYDVGYNSACSDIEDAILALIDTPTPTPARDHAPDQIWLRYDWIVYSEKPEQHWECNPYVRADLAADVLIKAEKHGAERMRDRAAQYHDNFLMTCTGLSVERIVASTEAIRALPLTEETPDDE